MNNRHGPVKTAQRLGNSHKAKTPSFQLGNQNMYSVFMFVI